MHDTAYKTGKLFLTLYWQPEFKSIVEIGAYNVNGTLRDFCPPKAAYVGIDYNDGPGVDIRVHPGEKLPLEDNSFDIVLSSSTFEHDACFWETFLDLARIVKPGGFIYISAPSNGSFHRCPADYWRFYPDAGEALARWAGRQGYEVSLVESCIAEREGDIWNDFVSIFHKKSSSPVRIPSFLTDTIACTNIRRFNESVILKERGTSEDMLIIRRQAQEIERLQRNSLHKS